MSSILINLQMEVSKWNKFPRALASCRCFLSPPYYQTLIQVDFVKCHGGSSMLMAFPKSVAFTLVTVENLLESNYSHSISLHLVYLCGATHL